MQRSRCESDFIFEMTSTSTYLDCTIFERISLLFATLSAKQNFRVRSLMRMHSLMRCRAQPRWIGKCESITRLQKSSQTEKIDRKTVSCRNNCHGMLNCACVHTHVHMYVCMYTRMHVHMNSVDNKYLVAARIFIGVVYSGYDACVALVYRCIPLYWNRSKGRV
jgi:hypothetical protein